MKSTRVAILMIIMMSFVQILEANQLECVKYCSVACIPDQVHYLSCFTGCCKLCPPPSTTVASNNCAQSCGVNKTITVHIGI